MKKAVDQEIKKVLAEEVEYKYTHVVATEVNSSLQYMVHNSSFLKLLNGTSQGDTVNSRQGNQILCDRIDFDVEFTPSVFTNGGQTGMTGSFGGQGTSIRYGIIWDKEPNGAILTLSGSQSQAVFDDLGLGFPYTSMKRLTQDAPQYKLLLDKQTVLQPCCIAHDTVRNVNNMINEMKHFRHKVPVKCGKTRYAANAGTIADITHGSLYFFVIAQNDVYVEYDIKTWFTDV